MKHHSHTDIDRRLARAGGHIEAVRRMIAEERNCTEVLQQIKAVISALENARRIVATDHIQHCISDAIDKRQTKTAIEEVQLVLSNIW